jgi:catechol 2,3-dioxygenase-like lactoylglutathione lyase family enzyme
MTITSVDHVVVAVRDLAAASATYERLLGLRPSWRGVHPGFGTANTLFRLANTYLELLAPSGEGLVADALRAYLDDCGDGPLALAFGTADARAAAASLRAHGMPAPDPSDESGREISTDKERKWLRFSLPIERTRGVALMVVQHLSPPDALPAAAASGTPESTVSAIDHVVIMTASAEGVISLYGDMLGLRLALDRTFEPRKLRLVFFRVGGLTVECAAPLAGESTLGAPAPTADHDRFWGISYRVPDIDAARERLSRAGVDVSEVRTGMKPGTRVCTVRSQTHGVATLLLGPGCPPSDR